MNAKVVGTVSGGAFGALLGAIGGHFVDEPVPGQPKNNTGALVGTAIGAVVGGFLGYAGGSTAQAAVSQVAPGTGAVMRAFAGPTKSAINPQLSPARA